MRQRPVRDWADLMFNPDHADQTAHIVPFSQPYSLCGATPLGFSWWGTGDMDEIETAAALPLCEKCEESNDALYR